MIKLNLNDRGEKWIDITDEARVKVRPFDAVVSASGRSYSNGRVPGLDDGEEVDLSEEMFAAFTVGVAKSAILEWSGVTDENDEEIPVTRDAVEAAMQNRAFFAAFQSEYVMPWLLKEAEKNASTSSLNGSTAEAKNTAGDVPSNARNARSRKTAREPKK